MARTIVDVPEPEPGLYLFATVTPDTFVVHSAAPIARAPRMLLRSPRLTKELTDARTRGAAELVLALIEPNGTVVDSFGWPAETEVFHCPVDSETGDFKGGPVRQAEWDARFRIPIRPGVRYLEFYRVEAARTNPAPSGTRALALYDLTPGPGILPPLPVPWPKPPTPLPMPPLDLLRSARWELRWRVRETRRVLLRNGYIKDAATLVAKGDPANCFDIVILGDGFLDSELGVFDYQANLLAQGLLATWPFSDFVDKVNVHVVRAVSLQSGITDVPLGTIRKTYFETRGYWNGKPSPSFIGTAATSVVLDAIDTIIPHEHANLIIIVTNNLLNGGSAPPELGMAFVTLNSTDAGFLNVAAHESGHVIAKLAEEYVSCTERDSTRTYPNEVTQAEVNAKNVWWTTLATAAEKDSSGFLATIHTYGDPLDTSPGADTCQPPPGLRNILGLFWGGQNSNPPHPTACSNYCDADGAAFYRPMAECKMRRRKYGFCRVCGYLISTVIASTTS